MSGVYSVEDLLKLRASPLICRPPNLPPMLEWMGIAEVNPKRAALRSKPEETTFQSEGFQKRPTLSDTQRRSTTDPERIVLGPPRRSFASSNARVALKVGNEGNEEAVSLKDKGEYPDRIQNGESADRITTKANGATGRYTTKIDQDSAQQGRSRRRLDDGEESKTRTDSDRLRDRDRPRWGPKEAKDESRVLDEDNISDHPPKSGFRRDVGGRSRYEHSWSRGDRNPDAENTARIDDRGLEWRSDRVRPREWDRSTKIESDPEWMDAPAEEEAAPVRTQEDFQRWKERMRAGTMTSSSIEEKGEAANIVSSPADIDDNASKVPLKSTTVEGDEAMNKFFARFTEPRPGVEQKPAPGKSTTKTRFASLFTPTPEILPTPASETLPEIPFRSPVNEKPATPATPSTADADQAGFARILEMLQTRGNNPTPQSQDPMKARAPLYARDSQSKAEQESKPQTQNLMSLFGQTQTTSPHDRAPEPKSPAESSHNRQQSSISKDEVLLNLLRQASLAPKPQPMAPQHYEQRASSAGNAGPNPHNRGNPGRNPMFPPVHGPEPMHVQRHDAGRLIFNESPPPGLSYMDEPGLRDGFPRGLSNMPNQSFYEEQYMTNMRQGGPNQQQNSQQGGQANYSGLPPGLQRPPGLDQMPQPPPGWPNTGPPPPQQSSISQLPRHPAPPPGFSSLPRGMPGNLGAPPNMQAPSQTSSNPGSAVPRPPQRKYTGDTSMPNFPPGIGPPPGFMNPGPPPGFPGAPPQHHNRFPFSPGEQPPPPPQNMGRAFMEMYGNEPPRQSVRGGAAPPNYR